MNIPFTFLDLSVCKFDANVIFNIESISIEKITFDDYTTYPSANLIKRISFRAVDSDYNKMMERLPLNYYGMKRLELFMFVRGWFQLLKGLIKYQPNLESAINGVVKKIHEFEIKIQFLALQYHFQLCSQDALVYKSKMLDFALFCHQQKLSFNSTLQTAKFQVAELLESLIKLDLDRRDANHFSDSNELDRFFFTLYGTNLKKAIAQFKPHYQACITDFINPTEILCLPQKVLNSLLKDFYIEEKWYEIIRGLYRKFKCYDCQDLEFSFWLQISLSSKIKSDYQFYWENNLKNKSSVGWLVLLYENLQIAEVILHYPKSLQKITKLLIANFSISHKIPKKNIPIPKSRSLKSDLHNILSQHDLLQNKNNIKEVLTLVIPKLNALSYNYPRETIRRNIYWIWNDERRSNARKEKRKNAL